MSMIWKEYLLRITNKLKEYLKGDIQYSNMPRSEIRRIAWREIELFIEDFKKWSPEKLILNENKKINLADQNKLVVFLNKRQKGIPLAHILKKQQFYGLEFEVNKHTLIPRPETEELVEYVLHFVGTGFKPAPTRDMNIILIDIGTGSGCILTAILKNLPGKVNFSEIYAVDKSRKALKTAEKNIKKHLGKTYKVNFIQGSLLQYVPRRGGFETRPYIKRYVIVANLPYLSEKEYQNLSPEVKNQEPKSALVGGEEGHELICKLIDQARAKMKCFEIFLEISPAILPKIKEHLAELDVPLKQKIKHDLNGKARILHVSSTSE